MAFLTILREITPSPSLVAYFRNEDTAESMYEFADGRYYIDNDRPRDAEISVEIAGGGVREPGCTRGFAIVDENWNIQGRFRDLAKAEAAVQGAKMSLAVDIEADESE